MKATRSSFTDFQSYIENAISEFPVSALQSSVYHAYNSDIRVEDRITMW